MRILLIFILLLALTPARAARVACHTSSHTIPDTLLVSSGNSSPADSAAVSKQIWKHKKIVAAALSFPLPFGWLGLHRIYLGTAPWVPIVYVVTFGGCFGILPLVDFVVILIKKPEELKSFQNNNKVFMWE